MSDEMKEMNEDIEQLRGRQLGFDNRVSDVLSSILAMKSELLSELHAIRKDQIKIIEEAKSYTDATVTRCNNECKRIFLQAPQANTLLIFKIVSAFLIVAYVAANGGFASVELKSLFGMLK
jgi:flagellar biosynthesis/type III secretory pathway chaperone